MPIRALYLHIPFCHAKCAYCDFESFGLRGQALCEAASAYLPQLIERLDAFGARGALESIETVYVGGGTPTVLGEGLVRLVERVRRWCAPVEFTCEANPESFDEDLACALAQAGVTRVSLGVQSMVDEELARIGRLHNRDGALHAIAAARAAGLTVSVDCMCGLPGQTAASWERTLEGVLSAQPDHVSVYPLTLEEGTPLARQAERDPGVVPDEDFQATCMERARDVLSAAGFERYEVASYARSGRVCRHNIAYWTGASYLGLGRSAAGMLTGAEFRELAELFPSVALEGADALADDARVRLVQGDDAGTAFEGEVLTPREALAEDLMLGMRMTAGVSEALIARARELLGSRCVDAAVREALERGLARWTEEPLPGADACGRRLAPTDDGWLLGNELYGLFWDLAVA